MANSPEKHDLVSLANCITGKELKKEGTWYGIKSAGRQDSYLSSLKIKQEAGFWQRYSDESKGGIISFIMKFGDKSFLEAVELLEP